MNKKILIFLVMLFLFFGCEQKKSNKLQAENISTKSDKLNTTPAPSAQPEITQLKITKVITDNMSAKKKIKVTFIELGSVRCIPCKMMMPIMKEIEEKYGDEVKVVFYDVWTDAGRPYAEKYGIHAIPTQVFLDENGKEFFRHVGFFPKEEILTILKNKGVNIKY
ncbi:MAG: thioredoxin family protein [Candidatus Goldbacteria bacterium]|nr:thioredoxin family protein [Candidatus Goldiibacteriota bacterium]